MDIKDKQLLAILNVIQKDKISKPELYEELEKLGVAQDSKKYNFLIENGIIEFKDDAYRKLHPQSHLTIKMKNPIQYIYLTEEGVTLWNYLRALYLKEKFLEITENKDDVDERKTDGIEQ